MNDIKDIFDKTLPENEPPMVIDTDELLTRGQRRQKRRRIGFASGGSAAAVAMIAAIALMLPGGGTTGPSPAAEDKTESEAPEVVDDHEDEPLPDEDPPAITDDLDEHTVQLLAGVTAQAPDLTFAPTSRGVDPFVFHQYDIGQPWAAGADVMTSNEAPLGYFYVTVHLPDTGWGAEPAPMSRWAFHTNPEYLYSCWGDDYNDDYMIETECVNETGPNGEDIVLITQRKGNPSNWEEIAVGAVVFRADGTALRGYYECASGDEDEETSAASCSTDTFSVAAIADLLVSLPPLPDVID